jgi:cobalt-zinc-cadmium efflux system outer membrane protein
MKLSRSSHPFFFWRPAQCGWLLLGLVTLSPVQAITLSDAERALSTQSRDIAAAAIELRGSEGDASTAAQRPPLELGAGSSKISTREGIGPGRFTDKRIDSTLGVSWTWERGGKRQWRMRHARGLADAAGHDLADSRRTQMVALHEAYYGLKAAQERLAIANENRELAERGLAATDRQVAVGDLAPIERSRLAVEALKIADEARDAAQARLEAQQQLALLIGHENDYENLSADDDWPVPAAVETQGDVDSLYKRADQLAAGSRVAAADAGRELARSLRKRDIGIGFETEREPTDIAGVTWGFSVSIPLVGPNYHSGEIVRAEADYDAAVLARDRLRAESRTELQRLRSALASAEERHRRYENELAPAAKRAVDGIELAYRRGAANLTDLLDARRIWREAETDLIEARAGYAVALAEWRAAARPESAAETAAP